MKSCVNCAYCRHPHSLNPYYRCGMVVLSVSPVTGRDVYEECEIVRGKKGKCGPDASLYKSLQESDEEHAKENSERKDKWLSSLPWYSRWFWKAVC